MKHLRLFIVYSLFFSFIFSCKKEESVPVDQPPTEESSKEVPGHIIEKLDQIGFFTHEGLSASKGGYVVEYDIFMTEEEINELAHSSSDLPNGKVTQYRTFNVVECTPKKIKIYMEPGFKSYMYNALNVALGRYNYLNLNLTFEVVSSSSHADITISSSDVLDGIAEAGFPQNGGPYDDIWLNNAYFNGSIERGNAVTVIAHEIGHCIGLRHTDYMDRSISCGGPYDPEGEVTYGVGAVHIPGTPTGADYASYMLACIGDNEDRPFTHYDNIALKTLYPKSNWIQLPGQGRDIGIGANGSAWTIGNDSEPGGYGIHYWNGSSWTKVPGGAVRISVGVNGEPWIINSYKTIYKWTGNGWQQMPGKARDIGVGANGSVWVIGDDAEAGGYGIHYWNGSTWTKVPGSAERIAVDPSGNPWIINNSNVIYRRSGSSWQQLPGLASDIGIGADGTAYVIGRDAECGGFGVHKWNGSVWIKEPGSALNIAVGPTGKPWLTNNAFVIYRQ